eukprot:ctg_698.g344
MPARNTRKRPRDAAEESSSGTARTATTRSTRAREASRQTGEEGAAASTARRGRQRTRATAVNATQATERKDEGEERQNANGTAAAVEPVTAEGDGVERRAALRFPAPPDPVQWQAGPEDANTAAAATVSGAEWEGEAAGAYRFAGESPAVLLQRVETHYHTWQRAYDAWLQLVVAEGADGDAPVSPADERPVALLATCTQAFHSLLQALNALRPWQARMQLVRHLLWQLGVKQRAARRMRAAVDEGSAILRQAVEEAGASAVSSSAAHTKGADETANEWRSRHAQNVPTWRTRLRQRMWQCVQQAQQQQQQQQQ